HNIFESVINNLSKVHTSNQRCFCHNLKTGEC
ncbi:transcriptional regulator, partial [Escherichia coli]|nr:transcriptional regulator [Escherichia coli]